MKIITNIVLLLISLLLSAILLGVGFLYTMFRLIGYSSSVWEMYFYRCAKAVDELGNVVLSRPLNDVLITKKLTKPYEFGLPGETISGVLGKNLERGTLTVAGKVLNWILNKIQKNHSVLSIDNSVDNKI